jgi:ABC-type glycerol-3-phosphate transport system substrate-binding protein
MRRRLRLLLVLAAVAVAAATVAPAGAQEARPDVVGTWTVSIATTGGGTDVETWRIRDQTAGNLTGAATGAGWWA